MSRSMSAWSTAIGFGCWKKGCGVWCGDERKTTRRAWVARRSTTAGAVVGGAVQTRKTAPTPRSPASSDSGTVRSPVTTSTFAGSVAAASERCVRARTGTPASIEEVDDDAPNPAGRSGDEHRRHSRPCHEDLAVSVVGAQGKSSHLHGHGVCPYRDGSAPSPIRPRDFRPRHLLRRSPPAGDKAATVGADGARSGPPELRQCASSLARLGGVPRGDGIVGAGTTFGLCRNTLSGSQ